MKIDEVLSLMKRTKIAKANPNTNVGAVQSLQEHLKVMCSIGPPLQNGKLAVYANAPEKDLPKSWHGYPVVSTYKE